MQVGASFSSAEMTTITYCIRLPVREDLLLLESTY